MSTPQRPHWIESRSRYPIHAARRSSTRRERARPHLSLDISPQPVRNAAALKIDLGDARSAMATQTDLTTEFHWQLRGLFALLRTLVRQTTSGRHTVEDYANRLEGRISALSRVYEMRMRAPAEGLDLHELASSELIAQAINHARYQIDGPEIRLAHTTAAPLALVFHELTMNACEHGALIHPEGGIALSWNCYIEDDVDWLQLEWRERGGALGPAAHLQPGFGWELIQRLLPYEFGARAEFQRDEDGIRWKLMLPALATDTVWRRATDKS